jgi:hypothetical protein
MADSTPPSKQKATTKSSAKLPTKKAASVCASPRKKANFRPGNSVVAAKYPLITSYAFHADIQYEAYIYAKDDHNDGYLNSYKTASTTQELPQDLRDAGFAVYQRRRIPGTSNEVMKQKNKPSFDRIIILRTVESTSTPATRKEGLNVLKAHLLNPNNSRYPPSSINIVDNVTKNDISALDTFFLDDFIDHVIQEMYDEDDINSDFYSTYPELAKQLWSGSHYSEFARALGFPDE